MSLRDRIQHLVPADNIERVLAEVEQDRFEVFLADMKTPVAGPETGHRPDDESI